MASKVILIKSSGVTRGFNTIQSAINGALSGDTLTVYNGTYNEQVIVKDSVDMFCLPGVIITSNNINGTLIDNSIKATVVLIGKPTITNTGGGNSINLTNTGSYLNQSNDFQNLTVYDNLISSGTFDSVGNIITEDSIHVFNDITASGNLVVEGTAFFNSTSINYTTSASYAVSSSFARFCIICKKFIICYQFFIFTICIVCFNGIFCTKCRIFY